MMPGTLASISGALASISGALASISGTLASMPGTVASVTVSSAEVVMAAPWLSGGGIQAAGSGGRGQREQVGRVVDLGAQVAGVRGGQVDPGRDMPVHVDAGRAQLRGLVRVVAEQVDRRDAE